MYLYYAGNPARTRYATVYIYNIRYTVYIYIVYYIYIRCTWLRSSSIGGLGYVPQVPEARTKEISNIF